MKILRIKSHNMHDALAEARRQLGDGVTVLHTKQHEEPVWFGLGRQKSVEILAAADDQPSSAAYSEAATACAQRPVSMSADTNQINRQIADIQRLFADMNEVRESSSQPAPSPIYDRLVRNGVPERLAEILAEECSSEDLSAVLAAIARRIAVTQPVAQQDSQERIALVGPTGVGKTTTAAKLAARYSLVYKKKVALLTLDTYRIGAIEQLATYARIMNIPLEVALCPEDVDALVCKHKDKDVIIIDTVGRSQRNREHLDELRRFVRAAEPTEVHLVVSASSSPTVQKESVESFSSLLASRLLLTKLDECPQMGCILGLAANSILPFSYITYGQEVPDDIALADAGRLAKFVWEGSL
ncbi:MAG TPA: flagellar biosynthesis protein FlhF [Armatimonadota bacterium]|nr:flagellar biosynthesis protein FlhF [Armatimonadota bacterium]